jgi:hypothetical protein
MRSRTQRYNLWTDRDRLVITVLCPVIESNLFLRGSILLTVLALLPFPLMIYSLFRVRFSKAYKAGPPAPIPYVLPRTLFDTATAFAGDHVRTLANEGCADIRSRALGQVGSSRPA